MGRRLGRRSGPALTPGMEAYSRPRRYEIGLGEMARDRRYQTRRAARVELPFTVDVYNGSLNSRFRQTQN
jgi:hypothetical protein